MTISLGWFIVLCIFGFIGLIAAMWIIFLIYIVVKDMICHYKKYKDYYLEHERVQWLKTLNEQQEQQNNDIEETENSICATCRINNQCPIDHKPNLQCPYNNYEKR